MKTASSVAIRPEIIAQACWISKPSANAGGVFADVPAAEPLDIVGFIDCGGCPGRNPCCAPEISSVSAPTPIVFASCITKGTPIGYPCPFAKRMQEIVKKDVGENFRIPRPHARRARRK